MSRQPTSHIAGIVGQNIRIAREAKGLKQRDVARSLDVDSFQVSRWERGLHRPTDATLFVLAEMLERDFAWFFTEPDEVAA